MSVSEESHAAVDIAPHVSCCSTCNYLQLPTIFYVCTRSLQLLELFITVTYSIIVDGIHMYVNVSIYFKTYVNTSWKSGPMCTAYHQHGRALTPFHNRPGRGWVGHDAETTKNGVEYKA